MAIRSVPLRFALLVTSGLLVLGGAISASAQCLNSACGITAVKPAGGSFQIGGRFPVPGLLTNPAPSPAPTTFIGTQMAEATPYAWVFQGTSGGSTPPPSIMMVPSLFKHAANTVNVGMLRNPPKIWQIVTNFGLTFPAGSSMAFAGTPGQVIMTPVGTQWVGAGGTFRAGGRTGGLTVSWCPGDPLPGVTMSGGTCAANGGPGTPAHPLPGIVHYSATSHQFGGPVAFNITTGVSQIALVVGFAPGCPGTACKAIFASGSGTALGAIGNAFGFVGTSPPIPMTSVAIISMYTSLGRINGTLALVAGGGGLTNRASLYGGPWTTGVVMVTRATSMFTLTGSDARVSGQGQISLVAGAVVPTATRGWLSFTVPEPSMALGAGAALLMLAACHLLVRRRSR